MINLYSIVYDYANFLELQYLSFKKACSDPIKFTVINNTNSPAVLQQVLKQAHLWGWGIIDTISPRFDNGGFSHQQALKTAVLRSDDGVCVILDPDVFAVKSLDPVFNAVRDEGYVFSGIEQGTERIKYLWPGFLIFNNPPNKHEIDLRGALINEDNFNDFIVPDPAEGWTWDMYPEQRKTRIPTDSGGLLCRYIKKHESKVYPLSLDFIRESCYDDTIIPSYLHRQYKDLYNIWIIGGSILHTGRASNWDNRPQEEVDDKIRLINELMKYHVYKK